MPIDMRALGADLAKAMTAQLAPVLARLKALEDRAPTPGPKGDPGKDAAPVDEVEIAAAVQRTMVPIVDKLVDTAVGKINPPRGEKGEQGPQGEAGPAGKDAPAIDEKALAERVASSVAALLPEMVGKAVADYLKANPPAAGRDGRDGERGEKGDTGASGVGVAGALIDRDGVLKLTMSDGRVETLGVVVGKDGRDGANGKDGLSLEAFEMTYLPETHEFAITAKCAGRSQELRYPAGGLHLAGYWRDGVAAKAGEVWTSGGSSWAAKRDTKEAPRHGCDDWVMQSRAGRDAERVPVKRNTAPSEPIKLKPAGE